MQAGRQADRVTSEGALSRATVYWKDGVQQLRAARSSLAQYAAARTACTMSIHKAFSRFTLVRALIKRNPLVETALRPQSQLSCASKISRSQHHLSIVGETEEFWAREAWAITGKQSRPTLDVATYAVPMWV